MRKLILFIVMVACSDKRGSDDQGSFVITGSIPSPRVDVALQAMGTYNPQDSKRVTHVMAVSPTAVTPLRRLTTLGGDGSFSLTVNGGKPWMLVFLDQYQAGNSAVVSVLQIEDFITIPVLSESGSFNAGTITLNASTGLASSTITAAEMLTSLGVSTELGTAIAALDDIALRYKNPDIDGNSAIDTEESNKMFALDFHSSFVPKISGVAADMDDALNTFLYDQSGFTLVYSKTSAIGHWSWSVDTAGDYVNGSNALINSASFAVDPTSSLSGIDYVENTFSVTKGFGPRFVVADSESLPSGNYVYTTTAGTFTFTGVSARSNSTLSNMENMPMPFIKFTPTTTCTLDCSIASIEYSWRKLVSGTWTELGTEELALLTGSDATLKFYNGDKAANKVATFEIPKSAVSGTIAWSIAGAKNLTGLSDSEFSALKTRDLCDMELYYDDAFGHRLETNVLADAGTCN